MLIAKDNVEEYYKTNIDAQPTIDWNDLWGRVTGAIRDLNLDREGAAHAAPLLDRPAAVSHVPPASSPRIADASS